MLDREKALSSRAPGEDEEEWLKKLSELEVQEERLLDLYLEGKLESDRYEPRVSQLKRSRKTPVEELEHIRNRTTGLERLEQDRDALLDHYTKIAVEHLDILEPEERNRVYKMLGIKFLAHEDGNLEVKWTLGWGLCRDNEPLPRWNSESTTLAFRFRAVLTDDANVEVELARYHQHGEEPDWCLNASSPSRM
jgi:hypothetical protein